MIDLPTEELAGFRLEILGAWTVEEFQSLLVTINNAYKRIAPIMLLWELIREEKRRNNALGEENRRDQQDWHWHVLYHGSEYYGFPERPLRFRHSISDVLTVVLPFVVPLDIDGIKLESPGWVQVIGNLNPLKVIADFISKWRAENTKRLGIQKASETERERIRTEAAIERERLRKGFVLEVLRQMPSDLTGTAADRLPEMIEHAINPTMNTLEHLSVDSRVRDATVVTPGLPLPRARVKRKM